MRQHHHLHAEVRENEELRHEGERLERVLGTDFGGVRGVVVAVVRVADAAEEERHDAGEREELGDGVGGVGGEEDESQLELGVLAAHVDELQDERAQQRGGHSERDGPHADGAEQN